MTSKLIQLKDSTYTLNIGYQNIETLRKEFNRLCYQVWKFDFENYYQSGYWGEDCILFSLFKEDRIVSHITLSIFETIVDNKVIKIGQLGTVMTDPEFQHNGLSRYLMECITAEYNELIKGYFLFTNDTVLDFYPKFGYTAIDEYQASIPVSLNLHSTHALEKLDLDHQESFVLFKEYVQNGYTYNTLETRNVGLTFFYCYANPAFGFKDSIYYSSVLDAVIIYQKEEGTVVLYAIYQKDHTARRLDQIIKACCSDEDKVVHLAFSTDIEKATYSLYKEDVDITLMVTKELAHLFHDKKKMVASLSHT